MEQFLQFAVTALALGGVYSLLALGLATVFGLVGFLNFAHGDLMTVCGYTIFFCLAMSIPFPPAALIGIIAAGLVAVLMERVAFRPLRGRSPMTLLLTTFALSLAIHIMFQVFVGTKPKPIPIPPYLSGYFNVGGIIIARAQVIAIFVSIICVLGLSAYITRTRHGNALRAASEDFGVARTLGIPADRMIASAFLLSGLLAGVAAILWIAQRGSVTPTMGLTPMIKALIAVIMGGLSHPKGAIYGGLCLGVAEAAVLFLAPSEMALYRDAVVLTLLIVFLLFRPNGIVGSNPEPAR
ncbi:MAG: branched-chain amino acid ABC transporter permease [Sedimentitalea sp.]